MINTDVTLNFFGDEIKIAKPKTFDDFAKIISEKFNCNIKENFNCNIEFSTSDKNSKNSINQFPLIKESYEAFLNVKEPTTVTFNFPSEVYQEGNKNNNNQPLNNNGNIDDNKKELIPNINNQGIVGEIEKKMIFNSIGQNALGNQILNNQGIEGEIESILNNQFSNFKKEIIEEAQNKLINMDSQLNDLKLSEMKKENDASLLKNNSNNIFNHNMCVSEHRVPCSGCNCFPIIGIRYKCTLCPSFDFCEKCEKEKGSIHNHPFYMLRYPIAPDDEE